MKNRIKRQVLLALAMAPIAAVSFAAKSALSIGQLGKAGVSDSELARSAADSRGQ
jgi:hypothetical protein